jgi:hypothetical protein
MSGYRITLYEDGVEGAMLPPFVMPTLPYPGLRIDHGGGMWEVLRVQLHIAQEGSVAHRNNEPPMVQVAVRATVGIHPE